MQPELFFLRKHQRDIKMVEQQDCNSPPPTDTSKIHLHLEKFSPKTNWKWAERHRYNQGFREGTMWNWVGKEEKGLGWDKRREITWVGGDPH